MNLSQQLAERKRFYIIASPFKSIREIQSQKKLFYNCVNPSLLSSCSVAVALRSLSSSLPLQLLFLNSFGSVLFNVFELRGHKSSFGLLFICSVLKSLTVRPFSILTTIPPPLLLLISLSFVNVEWWLLAPNNDSCGNWFMKPLDVKSVAWCCCCCCFLKPPDEFGLLPKPSSRPSAFDGNS